MENVAVRGDKLTHTDTFTIYQKIKASALV